MADNSDRIAYDKPLEQEWVTNYSGWTMCYKYQTKETMKEVTVTHDSKNKI